MSSVYKGGCACGAIRYEVRGNPVAMCHCQCRQCQRESGTGHASHLIFAAAEVSTSGTATAWSEQGDSGATKTRSFCPTCGAPVYMRFPAMPDIFVLRAASLDDPAQFAPQFVTFASAAQNWDRVPSEITAFDDMPPR